MAIERLSVVIPCFNQAHYLSQALDSVIQQEYPNLEIIIVDDGSTDHIADVIKRYPQVIYISQQQQGACAARNTGIDAATGSLLAFLDADDLWEQNKIHDQLAILQQQTELDMVFGHARQFISSEIISTSIKIPIERQVLPGLLPSAMLIRTDSFRAVGKYDSSLTLGDEVMWLARAKDYGLRYCVLKQIVLLRRIHESNTARNNPILYQSYLRGLKKTLDRRRQNQN